MNFPLSFVALFAISMFAMPSWANKTIENCEPDLFQAENLRIASETHERVAGFISGIPEDATLIFASNRLPFTLQPQGPHFKVGAANGGLVEVVRSTGEKFAWLGWLGFEIPSEQHERATAYINEIESDFDMRPVFMTAEEKKLFYDNYANRVIWPAFHGLELPDERLGWEMYQQINERFADELFKRVVEASTASEKKIIVWIHDYQLLLAPKMLKEKIQTAGLSDRVRTGFFLHIPFPSPEEFDKLEIDQRLALLDGVLGSDQISFQTIGDVKRFLSAVHTHGFEMRPVSLDPVGIDPEGLSKKSNSPATAKLRNELAERYAGYSVLVGVERLDPIKGIYEKLLGYQLFLLENPEYRGKVVLRQEAQASRMDIKEYQELALKLQRLVKEINEENAEHDANGQVRSDQLPAVILENAGWSRTEVLAHMGIADAILINSLRDGMNLVAFETEVVQRGRQNPGVLILSNQAGASHWLKGSLTVSPTSAPQIAAAIKRALTMPTEERVQRNNRNLEHIEKLTSQNWMRECLNNIYCTFDQPARALSVSESPQ
jgi:trehalose-6-phosphate synthase